MSKIQTSLIVTQGTELELERCLHSLIIPKISFKNHTCRHLFCKNLNFYGLRSRNLGWLRLLILITWALFIQQKYRILKYEKSFQTSRI